MARYIVDTNVILHAAFIDSYELGAIEILNNSGHSLCINEWVLAEAEKRLRALSWHLKSAFDPLAHLNEFISTHQIILLPYSAVHSAVNINRSDAWIVASAREHDAIVLTEDIPLALECKSSDVRFEIARNISPADEDIFIAGDALPRHKPSIIKDRRDGTVFVRIKTGNWSNQSGTSYIIDFCGLEIYYDRANRAWRAGMEDKKPIEIAATSLDDEVVDLYFCWKGAREGRLGEEFLMVCSENQQFLHSNRSTSRRQSISSHDTLHLGTDRNGMNQLNGYIQRVRVILQYISVSNIKRAYSVGTHPRPKTGNELLEALAHLDATYM